MKIISQAVKNKDADINAENIKNAHELYKTKDKDKDNTKREDEIFFQQQMEPKYNQPLHPRTDSSENNTEGFSSSVTKEYLIIRKSVIESALLPGEAMSITFAFSTLGSVTVNIKQEAGKKTSVTLFLDKKDKRKIPALERAIALFNDSSIDYDIAIK